MTCRILLVLGALALALAGCVPAEFEHPVSDPALARPDSALFGAWVKEGSGEPEIVWFAPLPRGGVQLVVTGADSSTALGGLTLRGFASRLGDDRYLSLRPLAGIRGHGGMPFADWHERARFAERWLVLGYEVSADGRLALAFFDDDKAEALIAAGRLHGTSKKSRHGQRVTSSTEELTNVLTTLDHDECFEREDVYHRIVPPPVDTLHVSSWIRGVK
jgi:hypothetical protein